MKDLDERASKRATSQHGLVTRSQAVVMGASAAMIDARVRAGRWVRVGPGVYRLAGAPVTWRQRALAAVLVGGPGAVLSHRAAAALWAIDGFRPGPLHVSVPAGRGSRNPLATVHRAHNLAAVERASLDGIPLTSVARTLVDVASSAGRPALERALDDVVVRRLLTLEAITSAVEGSGAFRGRATLRALLDQWAAGPVPGSAAEARAARLLVAAGLPEPVRQHEVRVGGRLLGRIDLAYPHARVGIEVDSHRWHSSPAALQRDRARRNSLEAAGWRILQAAPAGAGGHGPRLVAEVAALLRLAA